MISFPNNHHGLQLSKITKQCPFLRSATFFQSNKKWGRKKELKKQNQTVTSLKMRHPLANLQTEFLFGHFQTQSLVLVNFPRINSIPKKKKAAVKHEKNLCFLLIDKYHSFMLQLFATCKEKSVISTDEKEHTNKVDNSHNQRQELSKSK